MMNPKDIKKHPTFESLFKINPDVLTRIEAEMKETGKYDCSQPVILAQWEGQEEPVCIDGHTRIQAAINAGIQAVPVFTHEELESEEEAKLIAIKLQCNRRNLSDGELMTFLEVLDQPREQGRDCTTGRFTAAQGCAAGKSSEAIAQTLNISTRKAEEMLAVKRHGEPEVKQAVKDGQMSAHKAYQATQKKRRNTTPPRRPRVWPPRP